jgi:hypothetical protein
MRDTVFFEDLIYHPYLLFDAVTFFSIYLNFLEHFHFYSEIYPLQKLHPSANEVGFLFPNDPPMSEVFSIQRTTHTK